MRDVSEFRPLHMSMSRHRKTKRLMRLLDIPLYRAMGIVTALWCEVLDTEPDGVLEGWSDDDIANAVEWDDTSNATALVEALVKSGYLDRRADGVLEVHESVEYQGVVKKAHERGQARRRQAEARERRRREKAAKQAEASEKGGRDDSVTERDSHAERVTPPLQVRDFSPSPSPSQSPSRSEEGGAGGRAPPNASEGERAPQDGPQATSPPDHGEPTGPPPIGRDVSLERVLAGAFDGVRTIELMLPNGVVDRVYADHAEGMGVPGSKLRGRLRERTEGLVEEGAKPSLLLKASRVKRLDPYWQMRKGRSHDDRAHNTRRAIGAWGQMLNEVHDLAAAHDAGALLEPASTGPPRREHFDSDEAFQAAVDAFLDAPVVVTTRRRA